MKLELNLVTRTLENSYSFEVLKRERRSLDTESAGEVVEHVVNFIRDNEDIVGETFDKGIFGYLSAADLSTMGVKDLYSLKFTLAASGYDVVFYTVDDEEINPVFIEGENVTEYNVVDNLAVHADFVPHSSKLIESSEVPMSKVFDSVIQTYESSEDFYAPVKTMLESNIEVLSNLEKGGRTSNSLTFLLSDYIKNLGKEVVLMYQR